MERKKYRSGVKWESVVSYSRSVRVGSIIHVSGTTSTDEKGNIVGVDNPYQQTKQCLKNIEKALEALGGSLQHVIRTRMYVTNIKDWEEMGRAHGEVFHEINPTTSMIEVSALIDPNMLIEIEAEAILPEN